MALLLSEIISKMGLTIAFEKDPLIEKVGALNEANKGAISFLGNPKYAKQVKDSKAAAIFVPNNFQGESESLLIPVENPSKALSAVIELLHLIPKKPKAGRHASAVIDASANIGENCSIGANVVIEENCAIGDNTIILANCYIGGNAKIGSDCLIHSNVSIYDGCKLGDRVVVHSNTTIGSDGFGFEMEGNNDKIPQVGIVEIGNDVEIGANVSIDRARFDATRIGDYTKIDNLVQIAHNVQIGKGCFIVAQAGIAGSTKLGNQVIVAGQAGIVGHLTIGDGSIIAAKAGVGNDLKPGSRIAGFYGVDHKQFLRQVACLNQLPDLMKKVKKFLK